VGSCIRARKSILYFFPKAKLPRKAYTEDLLKKKVAGGEKGLKKHGHASRLDNNTCLYCLAPPATYSSEESLDNHPVFMELTRLLGVSCMHLKVRSVLQFMFISHFTSCCSLYELVVHVGVAKMVKPMLAAAQEDINKLKCTKAEKGKKMTAKKGELERQATTTIQNRFQGPQGEGPRCFIPEPQKGGNSNTGVCANRSVIYFVECLTLFPRFFINSQSTSEILELPERGVKAIWEMLAMLNSTHKMIDVKAFRKLARTVFYFYKEVTPPIPPDLPSEKDMAPYKAMTANLHLLLAHVPDWVEYVYS
jgi:hypothetical protein